MNVRTRTTWALLGVLALLPRVAAAQTTDSPPRVSLGAGAGLAIPFHGDLDFTPWAWEADLRVAMARHALFEVAVGEWRHTEAFNTQKTTRVQRTLQANLLFTGAVGRVRMNAGAGVGLLQHHRLTRQVTSECSPGTSCGSRESTFSSDSGSAQAVGGAEVRLAGRLALYGQARFVVPFTDPGGSDLRATAGFRWGFH